MSDPDFEKMSPQEIAQYQKDNCIFCKIIKGDIPSRIVYQDDKVFCILDINPASSGHTLIMSKEHYQVMPLTPQEILSHLFKITKDVSIALKKAVITDRSTVFIANGAVAGQQSPHFLFHIIPRESGDKLENFNITQKDVPQDELQKLGSMINARLNQMLGTPKLAQKEAKISDEIVHELEEPPAVNISDEIPGSKIDHLTQLIYQNPQLREILVKNPALLRQELEKNPELKEAFKGIDIEKLSKALSSNTGEGK